MTGHPIPAASSGREPVTPRPWSPIPAMARRELGWEPRYTSIVPIVETAWRWHKAHPHGYGD